MVPWECHLQLHILQRLVVRYCVKHNPTGHAAGAYLKAMKTNRCLCCQPALADGAYLEGFREYLSTAAQAGERAKPNPGAGAEASGQAHLWRDFGGMKTKQRIALVQEMQKVRDASQFLWVRYGGCEFLC